MYVPLFASLKNVGLIACHSKSGSPLLPDEQALLSAVANQLSSALERERLEMEAARAEQLRESEILHQTLLNSISHEIRTPLTAITGAAAELQSRLDSRQTAGTQELNQQITESAERLNHVVENLLDLSRLESGRLALRKEWHDPADVIAIALESVRRPLSRHTVNVVVREPIPLVRIDLQLFEHALTNLLLNAALHTPEGTQIEVGTDSDSDSVRWWVSDQGPGIPTETVPRIFEKFYRVSSSSAGTGIGLSIAKGIVEAHGGTISATNNPKHGCRFSVSLPLEEQPAIPREADHA
jgi:two-component system sensor histidine kinase KdpD